MEDPNEKGDEQREVEEIEELEAQWLDRLDHCAGGVREWDNPRGVESPS